MSSYAVIGPCYACRKTSCVDCQHELQRSWVSIPENFPEMSKMDKFIENLWRESEDLCFLGKEDGTETVLDQPFHGFPVGEFSQDDWLRFVDEHHSKGAGWVYDNITPV